ncbi:hypothetical protein DSM07_04780 [Oenococcus sp. UCMA 16435]|nr:hypothetical protein DSM07_04780 [Oenococcus sp. UCMA 16435]MDI4583859.1 hypothetical protein [Oenococcus sp. UCMA 14587]
MSNFQAKHCNLNFKIDSFSKFILGSLSIITFIVFLLISVVSFSYSFKTGFSIHRLIPGISVAAALVGIKRAAQIYKKTKDIRHALKVFGSWNVVSFLISWGGDWLVGEILKGNYGAISNW